MNVGLSVRLEGRNVERTSIASPARPRLPGTTQSARTCDRERERRKSDDVKGTRIEKMNHTESRARPSFIVSCL